MLLAESEVDRDAAQQIKVPASWNANGLSSHGYGTYQVTIVKSYEQKLGLSVPDIYSAHRLFCEWS